MDIKKFKKLPVIGILRDIEVDYLEPLIEAICESGLKTIEITMNTKKAIKLIEKAVKFSRNRLIIGAGTVLDVENFKPALDAGATFCVMPVFVKRVTEYCLKNKIPVFPGALTPLEVYSAWQAGATMVKVFPAKLFGPDYFKEIKGPFKDIELLACGGITPQNIKAYFSNGASAVAFGASVFKKEWLESKDFPIIRDSIKDFIGNLS